MRKRADRSHVLLLLEMGKFSKVAKMDIFGNFAISGGEFQAS